MAVNQLIARGIAPIGQDLPQIGNMLFQRDQARQQNALAQMAAQADVTRANAFADQVRGSQASAEESRRREALQNMFNSAVQFPDEVLPMFRQDLQQIAPDIPPDAPLPVIAARLGLQMPKPEAKYSVTEQPGPFGSRIVTDGERFQVVQPERGPAPAAPVRPNWTKVEVMRDGRPVVGFIDSNAANPESTFRSVGEAPRAGAPGRPIPAPALKMVDDANEAISVSQQTLGLLDSAINKLVPATPGQQPEAVLGPMANLASTARNFAGQSNPRSRAFADVKQTFEKLRNNYLLLAKGVQTEGDAARAWNSEIGENVQNDNALAAQQLRKAKALTEQAIAAQNARISRIYANFGQQPPQAGAPAPAGAPPAAPQRQVVRTGRTKDGRRVVQYSDGAVEVAQ